MRRTGFSVLALLALSSGMAQAQDFPPGLPCGPTTTTCPPPTVRWLDIPVHATSYRFTEYVVVGGWAFQCTRAIQQYAVELDGLFIGPAASGPVPTPSPSVVLGYRPDVAGYFNAVLPGCAVPDWSGFAFVFPPGWLSLGEHTIAVWAHTARWYDVAPTWYRTQRVTIRIDP